MKRRSALRILAFDEVSAFETAFIHRGARAVGKKRGASNGTWQQVKIDRQILAIARQHRADAIYTDDDMIAEAARIGMHTIRSSEIPLKPKQNKLDFEKNLADGAKVTTVDVLETPPPD